MCASELYRFLGFFDEQRDQLVKEGAAKMKSDIGWLDVTEGITGLFEFVSTTYRRYSIEGG